MYLDCLRAAQHGIAYCIAQFFLREKKIFCRRNMADCCFFCFSDEPVMNNGSGKHTDSSRGKYSMMGDHTFKVKMMDTPCESCFPCVRDISDISNTLPPHLKLPLFSQHNSNINNNSSFAERCARASARCFYDAKRFEQHIRTLDSNTINAFKE